MVKPITIPSFGFARGAVVSHLLGKGNLLVVRQMEKTTVVVAIEGDEGGTLRLREYPTSSLFQKLPSDLATRGDDVLNEAPTGRDLIPPPPHPAQREKDR